MTSYSEEAAADWTVAPRRRKTIYRHRIDPFGCMSFEDVRKTMAATVSGARMRSGSAMRFEPNAAAHASNDGWRLRARAPRDTGSPRRERRSMVQCRGERETRTADEPDVCARTRMWPCIRQNMPFSLACKYNSTAPWILLHLEGL